MTVHHDRDQAAWGSRKEYADGTLTPFAVDEIVIHWGGLTDPDGPDNIPSEAEEAAIMRGWQRYHIDTKGWFDIAYNTGVGNTGLTYRARGNNRSGATSGDWDGDGIPTNHEGYAIVWIGGANGEPSPQALSSMGRIVRELMADAGKELTVSPHSAHKATACPGDTIRAWIDRKGWVIPENGSGEPPYTPDRVFAKDWAWARRANIMTRHSDPRSTPTKQELAAHMRREVKYQDNGGTAK